MKKSVRGVSADSYSAPEAIQTPETASFGAVEASYPRSRSWPGEFFNSLGAYRTQRAGEVLPPHPVADVGVGRDRVLARDQGVGEPDKPGLLLSITRGLVRTGRRDLAEANVLLLPVGEEKLELLATPSSDGLW